MRAIEIFKEHWEKRHGKDLDETTLSEMQYCIDAIEEALLVRPEVLDLERDIAENKTHSYQDINFEIKTYTDGHGIEQVQKINPPEGIMELAAIWLTEKITFPDGTRGKRITEGMKLHIKDGRIISGQFEATHTIVSCWGEMGDTNLHLILCGEHNLKIGLLKLN